MSRNFQRLNFAGPSTVSGQAQTWWQVDLGEQHSLTCNYYTLRQDGSQDCVRNWIMQVGCLSGVLLSEAPHSESQRLLLTRLGKFEIHELRLAKP